MSGYNAITTTGGLMTDPNIKPSDMKRCVSCGAVGNVNLCPKCFKMHLEALDCHTDNLFSTLLSLHKAGALARLMPAPAPTQPANPTPNAEEPKK